MPTELDRLAAADPAPLESTPRPTSSETGFSATGPSSTSSATTDFSADPGLVMASCANCGAQMLDRKCKLICSCGYFLSCSDYY